MKIQTCHGISILYSNLDCLKKVLPSLALSSRATSSGRGNDGRPIVHYITFSAHSMRLKSIYCLHTLVNSYVIYNPLHNSISTVFHTCAFITGRSGRRSRANASHSGRSGNLNIMGSNPDIAFSNPGRVKPMTLRLIIGAS